jgi:hypothetical protein
MSDVVEVSAALLKRYMEFTRRLTPEQLAAIAAGELKFSLEPTRKAAGGANAVDTTVISAELAAMTSREAAVRYLDALKLPAAAQKQLAKDLGASIVGASSKVQVRDRIVEHCVGYKLNSKSIRDGAW